MQYSRYQFLRWNPVNILYFNKCYPVKYPVIGGPAYSPVYLTIFRKGSGNVTLDKIVESFMHFVCFIGYLPPFVSLFLRDSAIHRNKNYFIFTLICK